jgi:hypothetical protein
MPNVFAWAVMPLTRFMSASENFLNRKISPPPSKKKSFVGANKQFDRVLWQNLWQLKPICVPHDVFAIAIASRA